MWKQAIFKKVLILKYGESEVYVIFYLFLIITEMHRPITLIHLIMVPHGVPKLFIIPSRLNLTNQMWFSVVCTLIDNDIRHHSGQNVVDLRGAAE